jgi:hypothetical protein
MHTIIDMSALVVDDIFAHEITLRGRECLKLSKLKMEV